MQFSLFRATKIIKKMVQYKTFIIEFKMLCRVLIKRNMIMNLIQMTFNQKNRKNQNLMILMKRKMKLSRLWMKSYKLMNWFLCYQSLQIRMSNLKKTGKRILKKSSFNTLLIKSDHRNYFKSRTVDQIKLLIQMSLERTPWFLVSSLSMLPLFLLSLTLLIHFQLEIATLIFIMLVFIVFMETVLKIMKMSCTLQQLQLS